MKKGDSRVQRAGTGVYEGHFIGDEGDNGVGGARFGTGFCKRAERVAAGAEEGFAQAGEGYRKGRGDVC